MENLQEVIINKKLIYRGDFLDLYNVDVKLPDGKNHSRDVIMHPGAAAIVAFLDEENIILVEQFRLPLNRNLLEIPAGKLENKEDSKKCALRELEEETGYKANNIEYLGKIATAPGFCDEIIYLYKATSLVKGEKHEDEDEFTKVKIYKLKEVKEMVKKGEIIDTKTVAMFSYL
ncbi:NUDIX hydrolase [Clostridium sp.]|uniref:NUDIX hydrolase n=1 Tax=Clostridium sp. TaxID=1506 RepID=UPI002603F524|nr:NUDIX hydrolase [Clostridium sp.]